MIEIGEYIRTKKGKIHRIVDKVNNNDCEEQDDFKNFYRFENCMGAFEYYIKNHSKNIIDLIEVGDYVNGHEVLQIYRNELRLNTENDILCFIKSNEIKTILTHEQYENNSYKLEE